MKIYCENDGKAYEMPVGANLDTFAREVYGGSDSEGGYVPAMKDGLPILAGLVDNQLKQLDFQLMDDARVELLTYEHPDGRRTYIRSLSFVAQKAVKELFPTETFVIDYSLPSGIYCEVRKTAPKLPNGKSGGQELDEEGHPIPLKLSESDLKAIRGRMQELIDLNLPFVKTKYRAEEAMAIFEANDQPEKAKLMNSLGRFMDTVYVLKDERVGETVDTFYGPLVPTTGCLESFAISGFKDGFVLQYPMEGETNKIAPMVKQSKIAAILKRHSNWCSFMGITGIGTLNSAILAGKAVQLINLAETWHEKEYGEIADKIFQQRKKIRIVFIAGPSSSGKTSSSLRLALHCKNWGLNPKVMELDNYFVDREMTPKDENGEYDFEALGAMDLKLLNSQLNDLLEGKEVEIPVFNFKTGKREEKGNPLRLEEKDILVMEGIHALNPEMTPDVDNSRIFRVFASAVTSLSIDENNNISTSDNRLLRRMVRDNRVRGITPESTILRWHSVRRGENRNIFPFQENADATFNSALIFELPLLKYYAEPLLRRIHPSSPAYTEAVRLLKFLDYIIPLSPDEIAAVPPTSIIREFMGGQTL